MSRLFSFALLTLFSLAGIGSACAQSQRYGDVTLVFIPGIYGSTLSDEGGKVFWGDNGIGSNGLSLDKYPNLVPALFKNVRFSVGMLGTTVRGYAGIERNARHLAKDVLTFAYDWRKSNKSSSAQLNQFLCSHIPANGRRNRIVFVAHSMGGLVLRHWIKDFLGEELGSSSCIKRDDVETFIFAATPHIGSLEPVRTLFEGETNLDINPIVSSLFTGRMATDGITFESAYELLPAHNIAGPDCAGFDPAMAMKLSKDIGTGSDIPVYLNEIESWRLLEIPSDLPEELDRDSALSMIEQRVGNASAVVCELLSYTIPPAVARKMNFVVGELRDQRTRQNFQKTTLERVVIEAISDRDRTLRVSTGKGDGTVPYWSSEPSAFGVGETSDYPQATNQPHESVLDDVGVVAHLQRVIERAAKSVAWLNRNPLDSEIVDRASFDRAVQALADLPLGTLAPEVLTEGASLLTAKANDLGISGLDIYRQSRSYADANDPARAAVGYFIAAQIGTDLNATSALWANQNAAYFLKQVGNPELAAAAAIQAGKLNQFYFEQIGSQDRAVPIGTITKIESGWRSIITSETIETFDPGVSAVIKESPRFDPGVFNEPQVKAYERFRSPLN